MVKIYWAAPLHGVYEREHNDTCVKMLRKAGHLVYVPHEHGVWEDMVKEALDHDPAMTREAAELWVRKHLFIADKEAVEKCDIVVACGTHEDGSPSEGMIWEMGYAAGLRKPVYLINPEEKHWDYNLMPEFGSVVFPDVQSVINLLAFEEFV